MRASEGCSLFIALLYSVRTDKGHQSCDTRINSISPTIKLIVVRQCKKLFKVAIEHMFMFVLYILMIFGKSEQTSTLISSDFRSYTIILYFMRKLHEFISSASVAITIGLLNQYNLCSVVDGTFSLRMWIQSINNI